MNDTPINVSDPNNDLRNLVAEDRRDRIEATRTGLAALLKEQRTDLVVRVTMSSAQPQPTFLIDIIATD